MLWVISLVLLACAGLYLAVGVEETHLRRFAAVCLPRRRRPEPNPYREP